MGCKYLILFIYFGMPGEVGWSQADSWKLWAAGLPQGAYPRMAVAPNHDIYFALLGTPVKLGVIFKANTKDVSGVFTELPPVPRPASVQNNIVAIGYNKNSEPLAGIYRTDISEPWLFRFDELSQIWVSCMTDLSPTLGGQSMVTSPSGAIYVSTRWAYIYKSTDNGHTFKAIDETKLLASQYPCYYPSILNGATNNGSIFALNMDKNGRLYAGTETAGLIYSDDEGISWHPADLFSCKESNSVYNENSVMSPLARSGNVAGIGFTKDNNVVWSGVNMWHYDWKNALGYADMRDSFVSQATGFPDYLIQIGQQVSKIVTTDNGMMFLHSGSSNGATQVGIYRSWDGIHWAYFNSGITGANDGLSQGSLAVDGNTVFMATHDGKVWRYEAETTNSLTTPSNGIKSVILPNPAGKYFSIKGLEKHAICKLIDTQGHVVKEFDTSNFPDQISLDGITDGVYVVIINYTDGQTETLRVLKYHDY